MDHIAENNVMEEFLSDFIAHRSNTSQEQPHRLTQELCALESIYAERGRLSRLSAAETKLLLQRLQSLQNDLPEKPEPSNHALLTAIARLCADISNQLMDRLVDTVQQKQHSIDFLQQELSRKLREQHAASQLLQQTQKLRLQTQSFSDDFQLGSIL